MVLYGPIRLKTFWRNRWGKNLCTKLGKLEQKIIGLSLSSQLIIGGKCKQMHKEIIVIYWY